MFKNKVKGVWKNLMRQHISREIKVVNVRKLHNTEGNKTSDL